jgi:endonuclease/exonuclease/phosphatase family metal-dependent hydrolase
MKITRLLAAAITLLVIVGCGQQTKASQAKSEQTKVSLTLVQYNVGAFSKYDDSGVDAIVKAIKEIGADAVTLNEVDSCTTRTGCVDQLAAFAQSMGGWNHHYAAAMPYKGGAYGVGVASDPELKVVRTDKIALPRLDGREPRAVSVVEFEDFVLASTHLDLTVSSQLGQIEVINHYMDSVYKDSSKPVFIGGDFNCEPGSEPLLLMEKTWELLSVTTNSYPAEAPRKCIDFIYVRPNGRTVTVTESKIPTDLTTVSLPVSSDHLPVIVKLDIE